MIQRGPYCSHQDTLQRTTGGDAGFPGALMQDARDELMDRVSDGVQDEPDPSNEVEIVDAGTESETWSAPPAYSSISDELKLLEEYAELCGIEGACAGLCKANVAFI